MVSVEGETVIGRPPGEVFDFVADERNEPKYNPRMLRADKVTAGTIGRGTRFLATATSLGRPVDMLIEVTTYDRPTRFGTTTNTSTAEISGALTFEPHPAGTRMRWSWNVRPKGAFKLLTPVIGLIGKQQEKAIWTRLGRSLEAIPQGQPQG